MKAHLIHPGEQTHDISKFLGSRALFSGASQLRYEHARRLYIKSDISSQENPSPMSILMKQVYCSISAKSLQNAVNDHPAGSIRGN